MHSEATQDNPRWGWLRAQTPALQQVTYLNCGFIGPMSNAVADAFRSRFDMEFEL